VIKIKSQAPNI